MPILEAESVYIKSQKIRMFARFPFAVPSLAVSLNAPNDELRSFLMPGRIADDLTSLKGAMEEYCCLRKKEILVSYVLIQGINDSMQMAEDLSELLKGISVRINIIPFNQHGSSKFLSPTEKSVGAFVRRLRELGYLVFLRKTRGDDLEAACGQLAQKKTIA